MNILAASAVLLEAKQLGPPFEGRTAPSDNEMFALFDPKTAKELKVLASANAEMDGILNDFFKRYLSWSSKHVQLGSADSAVRVRLGDLVTQTDVTCANEIER